MTHDTAFDGGIETAEAFRTVLGQLLTEAIRNDIDPEGSWEYRFANHDPDWEVMVLELEKQVGSD